MTEILLLGVPSSDISVIVQDAEAQTLSLYLPSFCEYGTNPIRAGPFSSTGSRVALLPFQLVLSINFIKIIEARGIRAFRFV